MKLTKLILLVIACFLVAGTLSFIFYTHFIIDDIMLVPMDLTISPPKMIGFNVDTDKMHFGHVPVGSSSSFRNLTIHNNYNSVKKVTINNYGELGDWVIMELDDKKFRKKIVFYLEPKESKDVIYWAIPTQGEINQTFEGTSRVTLQKCITCFLFGY